VGLIHPSLRVSPLLKKRGSTISELVSLSAKPKKAYFLKSLVTGDERG
jgi:hypothetical protein